MKSSPTPTSFIFICVCLGLCFFGLVFSKQIFTISTALLIFSILFINLKYKNYKLLFFSNPSTLLVIGFYLLYVIGLIYSENSEKALFSLEKKLSLILFPVALASISPIKKQLLPLVFSFFIFSLSIACLILYFGTFGEYLLNVQTFSFDEIIIFINTYNRESLSEYSLVSIHHPYLGLFLVTAIIYIIINLSKLQYKALHVIAGSFLFLFLLQLQAKMSVISLLIVMMVYLMILVREYPNKLRIGFGIGFVFIIIIAVFSVYLVRPTLVNESVTTIVHADGGSRIRNWESALQAIKEAPIFGYGTGDKLAALQRHRAEGSWESTQNYNSHNQYLDTTLGLGLVGLTCWIIVLGHLFWKSYIQKDYFFALFSIHFAICSFTEVLLERFQGAALFALIYSIFANSSQTKKNVTIRDLKTEEGHNIRPTK